MRFEPKSFIELAKRNGITLTRIDKSMIRVDNATQVWIDAIRIHKRKLLKHLPEENETTYLQVDLFHYRDRLNF